MAQRDRGGSVLWDFDGTLARRPGRWSGALIEALDRVLPGHRHERAEIAAGLHGGFPWHSPAEGHAHLRTPETWWSALDPVLVGACTALGVPETAARAAAALVPSVYVDPGAWVVFPDALPSLRRLGTAGWRHVVLSNHVPELPRLVDALGFGDLVSQVLTSAATGYEKPHPRAFATALAAAGVDPASGDRVWMVGDSPYADVAGARAVGIPALLARTPPAEGTAGADLHQVVDVILRRRARR